MAEGERSQERLDNIRTVQPIVNALRTISLGSWQAALKRRRGLSDYVGHLRDILLLLTPHLPQPRWDWLPFRIGGAKKSAEEAGREVVLVVGSERGLCGAFNDRVVERALDYISQKQQVELWVLGERAQRIFLRAEQEITWFKGLATSALPSFPLAFSLTERWLTAYEERTLNTVQLIYNAYQGVGRYEPTVTPLIPPEPPSTETEATAGIAASVIIETDPMAIYTRVVEQWAAVHLYTLLLDSAAAEHATRYQLMEGAAQNAERLIDELTAELQAARRREITQEMQELAVGAGLLGDEQGEGQE
jgi:F-type H+-transporting ATPase subunit gamma